MIIKIINKAFYFLGEFKFSKFEHIGKGVKIYPRAKFMRPHLVSIDDYSSVGDFVFIETAFKMGRFSEFLTYATTTGREIVEIGNFVAVSHGSVLFTSVDTYTGGVFANSNVPEDLRNVKSKKIKICDHVVIGAGSLVFPGVTIGEGAVIGAGSVVHNDVEPWTINIGVPCKTIKTREREKLLICAEIVYKRYYEKGK
jgi:acetyltransferase-like isoleucine patch superfamily enzyme